MCCSCRTPDLRCGTQAATHAPQTPNGSDQTTNEDFNHAKPTRQRWHRHLPSRSTSLTGLVSPHRMKSMCETAVHDEISEIKTPLSASTGRTCLAGTKRMKSGVMSRGILVLGGGGRNGIIAHKGPDAVSGLKRTTGRSAHPFFPGCAAQPGRNLKHGRRLDTSRGGECFDICDQLFHARKIGLLAYIRQGGFSVFNHIDLNY